MATLTWTLISHTAILTIPVGPAGKKEGCTKPFDQLSSEQLQEELRARQHFDYGPTKKE